MTTTSPFLGCALGTPKPGRPSWQGTPIPAAGSARWVKAAEVMVLSCTRALGRGPVTTLCLPGLSQGAAAVPRLCSVNSPASGVCGRGLFPLPGDPSSQASGAGQGTSCEPTPMPRRGQICLCESGTWTVGCISSSAQHVDPQGPLQRAEGTRIRPKCPFCWFSDPKPSPHQQQSFLSPFGRASKTGPGPLACQVNIRETGNKTLSS